MLSTIVGYRRGLDALRSTYQALALGPCMTMQGAAVEKAPEVLLGLETHLLLPTPMG